MLTRNDHYHLCPRCGCDWGPCGMYHPKTWGWLLCLDCQEKEENNEADDTV